MKTVILTGATGGIGQAIAKHLSNENYNLILSSRNEDKLDTLKLTLQKKQQNSIQYKSIDYCSLDSSKQYSDWLQSEQQPIDGIVIITPRPVLKNKLFPDANEWTDFFQSSFIGPLELLRVVTPYLAKQGKVVIISGVTSTQLMPNCSTLGVLRSMWLAQAKSLSFELGPKGINVNTISPGGVLTDDAIARMHQKATSNNKSFEEQYSESVSNVPLRKYAQPQDIANVVEFFLSDKSNHLTGTNLICDGGFTKAY